MKIFFTSDTHFGHSNIIKYCNRPFDSIQIHDQALIDNWNSVVGKNDIVYHLGDFCLKGHRRNIIGVQHYLKKLNGEINFIWGNHDQALKRFAKENDLWIWKGNGSIHFLGDYKKIKIEEQEIILSHYSFRVWDKSHWGNWNLYGHSHGMLIDNPHARGIDVGVDCHNYMPISFDQVKEIMSHKLWQPIDHHGVREDGGGVGLSREEYARADRYRQYQQFVKEFGKI